MGNEVYSKCGMRCDLCLIYRPNVEHDDRRVEICNVYGKVWQGFAPNPKEIICDGCNSTGKDTVQFNPGCETRKCVMDRDLEHCGYCDSYPCAIFPAEPSAEVLHQKIDIEKQWTWEDEKLMEAYTCKKNMNTNRKLCQKQSNLNGSCTEHSVHNFLHNIRKPTVFLDNLKPYLPCHFKTLYLDRLSYNTIV